MPSHQGEHVLELAKKHVQQVVILRQVQTSILQPGQTLSFSPVATPGKSSQKLYNKVHMAYGVM